MANKRANIGSYAFAAQQVYIFREGFKLPIRATPERGKRHPLNLGEIARDQIATVRRTRGDGKTAIADHNGGDTECR